MTFISSTPFHGLPPWARIVGGTAVWLLIVLLLLPAVLRPLLDRRYYRGPASDHFDGQRFFNPEDGAGRGDRPSPGTMLRFFAGRGRAPWPASVPVAPGQPAAAAIACPASPARTAETWRRCVDRVDPRRMFATWIGHSTVLVQAGGITILTDPIWADRAGPWGRFGPKRVRAPGIRFDDLPKIDVVLLSHNHYDHMDLATLRRLWRRDRPLIVTSLGNDTILRGAGVEAVARDWGGRVAVRPGIEVIVERVHHWGSRWGSDRNRALWSGFTVTLPGGNLFFAGDTGLGDGRWPAEAARHGPIRLALIPIGAYLPRDMMEPSHLDPAEAVRVFRDLGAANALGVHWGTFRLSFEGFDAPREELGAALRAGGVPADRFVTREPGNNWEVPPLGR